MHEYYPLLLAGGIIGLISVVLIIAYATVKDKKQTLFRKHGRLSYQSLLKSQLSLRQHG